MTNTLVQDSFKDDKRIVTEVAFGVNPTLLGRKLATPFQRGGAMTIDAILVLLLTNVSGVFWALLFGAALFRAGRSRDKETWRLTRKLVRFLGVIIVLFTLVNWTQDWFESTTDSLTRLGINSTEQALSDIDADSGDMSQVIAAGKLALAVVELTSLEPNDGLCDINCLDSKVAALVSEMQLLRMAQEKATTTLHDALPLSYFDDDSQRQDFVSKHLADYKIAEIPPSDLVNINEMNLDSSEAENKQPENAAEEQQQPKPVYSVVEYSKALIADLGLGFGWAALYFTVFAAWWGGQTPGKRLFGIRVVQLDGTYMSAWESFGRYGGYGAGFATGLLGFAQVFWDDNRQSIQDKISATVVIQGGIE